MMWFSMLALFALAFGHVGSQLFERNDVCVVYTVVEQAIAINTCFPSNTVATVDGYTTTVSSATCVDTTVTKSVTLNPVQAMPTQEAVPAQDATPAQNAAPAQDAVEYTTITTDIYTTICPGPTTFTQGTKTYTITEATTITITDCPCTFTRTKHSSEIIASTQAVTSTGKVPVAPILTHAPPRPTTGQTSTTPNSIAVDPSFMWRTTSTAALTASKEIPILPIGPTSAGDAFISASIAGGPAATVLPSDVSPPSSAPSSSPSDPCLLRYTPGNLPPSINNAVLVSDPAPAVYTELNGTIHSFGFRDINIGALADAKINPEFPAVDKIAFYQSDTQLIRPTDQCQSFGYLYHIDSGLCIQAAQTSLEFPQYDTGALSLQLCETCTGYPANSQLFCLLGPASHLRKREPVESDFVSLYSPYDCVKFTGDSRYEIAGQYLGGDRYGLDYRTPSAAVATNSLCIFIRFPTSLENSTSSMQLIATGTGSLTESLTATASPGLSTPNVKMSPTYTENGPMVTASTSDLSTSPIVSSGTTLGTSLESVSSSDVGLVVEDSSTSSEPLLGSGSATSRSFDGGRSTLASPTDISRSNLASSMTAGPSLQPTKFSASGVTTLVKVSGASGSSTYLFEPGASSSSIPDSDGNMLASSTTITNAQSVESTSAATKAPASTASARSSDVIKAATSYWNSQAVLPSITIIYTSRVDVSVTSTVLPSTASGTGISYTTIVIFVTVSTITQCVEASPSSSMPLVVTDITTFGTLFGG